MSSMTPAPIVGIDLGTSFSSVSVVSPAGVAILHDANGQTATPSILAYPPEGPPRVGFDAMPLLLTQPQDTIYSFKRLLGRRFHSPEIRIACSGFPYRIIEGPQGQPLVVASGRRMTLPAVAADLLKYLKGLADWRMGRPITDAVITVPANATELQRDATQTACKLAGLTPRRIINEPTAAALAFGYAHVTQGPLAVYDFGGGTFDFSVLEVQGNVFRVLATAGDNFLGGDDIDQALARALADEFWRATQLDLTRNVVEWQRLLWAAEGAKRALSTQPMVRIYLENVGSQGGQSVHLDRVVTREMLEAVCRDSVERTLQICGEALREANLSTDALQAVVLVGGTTLMPLVRQAVAEFFRRDPDVRMDPLTAVAAGAAIQGLMLLQEQAPPPPPPAPVATRPLPAPAPAPAPRKPVDLHAEIEATILETENSGEIKLAPKLLDVSPHSVGVGTGDGVYQVAVAKNAPVPAEKKLRVRTWQDKQMEMVVRVYQGESGRADPESLLGELRVSDLPPRPKGMISVDLALAVDNDGRVKLTARQLESGKHVVARWKLRGHEEVDIDLS